MSAQPAKGPWRAEEVDGRITVFDADGEMVLLLRGVTAEDQRLRSIVRLIVSAPTLLGTLQAVEEWWLTRGMHVLGAAPPCIRTTRLAIHEATQPRIDEAPLRSKA